MFILSMKICLRSLQCNFYITEDHKDCNQKTLNYWMEKMVCSKQIDCGRERLLLRGKSLSDGYLSKCSIGYQIYSLYFMSPDKVLPTTA